jgi:GAF domain-containing protein/HAMP domain-containing protein
MVVGLVLIASLILLSVALFLWQVVTLRQAIRDLQAEEERLELALQIAQQATSLVVVVQNQTDEATPGQFVSEVGDSVEALKAQRDELTADMSLLPEGELLRAHMENVASSLRDTINVTEGAIRHADDANWPAVRVRNLLLLETQSDVEQRVSQLVSLVGERREVAQDQANQALDRMVFISVPMLATALAIATIVVFTTVRGLAISVEELSQSARRLAAGRFDERAPVKREDELGYLARAFNTMASELQDLYTGLEREVAQRTADLAHRSSQLEASAMVAREAAAIRDPEALLDRTVRLISERFGFYHAGIFLLDDVGAYAVLHAASSEGGQRMLERSHRLKVGEEGVVGHAAATGEAHIALDVGEDAVYFDNPDLPLTRSEMALPLVVRDQTIGILDVQSTGRQAFTDEDIALLQTLADQVALAIDNTRLLEEAQQAVRELETLYGRRARQNWAERIARQPAAYRYSRRGLQPISTTSTLEEEGQIVAPIRLRGETLGSIVLKQAKGRDPWSQEEADLVEEVSTQIGLALENARLLEEIRRRAELERLATEITGHMRETLDVEMVLQTAVQEISQALGLEALDVRLGTQTTWGEES